MRIQSSLDGESQQLILSVTSNLIEKFYPNLCGLINNTGNLPHGIQISRKDKTTAVVSFPVPQDSIVPVDGNPQMKGVNSTVFAPVIMLIREFTNLSLRNLTKKREFLPLNGYPEEDLQKDVIACLKAKRDIVIIDDWRGEVKEIGVRTTKLVDAGGNIKIVNNSDIRSIVNQTKDLSVAKCYVGISYGDRIERVEKVIADNINKIKENIPAIVEGPFYKGVAELAESSVNLLFVAKCKEEDIYQVQRDLNREIKIIFDDNNVNIPFPQVTITYDDNSNDTKLTGKEKKEVEQFLKKQKGLSKSIEEDK